MQKKDMLSFTLNISKISSKLHVASINKSVFNTDLLFACSHLLHSMLLLCYLSILKKQTKKTPHQTQFMLVQFSLKPSSVQHDFFSF